MLYHYASETDAITMEAHGLRVARRGDLLELAAPPVRLAVTAGAD